MDDRRGYGVGTGNTFSRQPAQNGAQSSAPAKALHFNTPMAYKPTLAQSSPPVPTKEPSLKKQLGLVDNSDSSEEDEFNFEMEPDDDPDLVPLAKYNALEEQLKRETVLREEAIVNKQRAEEELRKTKEMMARYQQTSRSQLNILKKSFDVVNAKQQDTIDELRSSMEDHLGVIKGLVGGMRARDPSFVIPNFTIPSAYSSEHDSWKSDPRDAKTYDDSTIPADEADAQSRLKELMTANAALGMALKQFEIDFSPNSSAMKDEVIRNLEAEVQGLKNDLKTAKEKPTSSGNDEIYKKEIEKLKNENRDLSNKLKQLKKAYLTLSNKKSSSTKSDEPVGKASGSEKDSQELQELQKQNKDLKKLCKALQTKLAETSAGKDSSEGKKKEEPKETTVVQDPAQAETIAKLEQNNAELLKKAKEYKAKIKIMEGEMEKVKAARTSERSSSEEAQAAIQNAQETLSKENAEMKKKMDALAEKYNKLKEVNAKAEKDSKSASKEIASLQETLSSTQADLAKTQTQLSDLRSRTKDLEKLDMIIQSAGLCQKQTMDIKKLFLMTKEYTTRTIADMEKFTATFQKQAAAKLSEYDAALSLAQQRYKKESRERKILYNQLQDLKGNIRVFVRVRPPSKDEIGRGYSQAVTFPDENQICVANKSAGVQKTFDFDRVFDWSFDQASVFEDTQPLVMSVTDGYNVSIIAYGQTGSGKTHTMEGPPNNRGVNYRSLQELFGIVSSRSEEYSFEIFVSYVEVYNETIKDLLGPQDGRKMDIKQGPEGIYVPDLTSLKVNKESDIHDIMDLGKRNRSVGVTSMNEHSSRSHAVLSIVVKSENKFTKGKTSGKLTLVDLAGSERLSRSKVEGERMLEAQNINKSLSALGDVIGALSSKNAHIPYRNSKLTYLLQDCLGGDSKTLMFIQVSPAEDNAGETLCSLNFAARVKTVELGQAKKHGDDPQLNYYRRVSEQLKSHIESNGLALPALPTPPTAAKKK